MINPDYLEKIMQYNNNRLTLIALMKKHGLTRKDVGLLLGVKKRTVDSWLANRDKKIHRNLYSRHIDLLILKLYKEKE